MCRTSAGASTRVTTRAFSNFISGFRARKCRGADWDWPFRRSSSKRTAARFRSKARSAGAAGSRSCCRCRYGGLAPGRYRDGLSEWEQTAAARCRQKQTRTNGCDPMQAGAETDAARCRQEQAGTNGCSSLQAEAERSREMQRDAERCEQNEKRTQSRHQCAADSNAPMPPNTKPPQNRSAAASHYRFSCFKCST